MDEKRVREAVAFFGRKICELRELEEQTGGVLVHNIERYLTAIEALEKQLPKKVEYERGYINNGFTKYRMAKCPNCDRWHSSRDEIIYCSKCGQKLDWSEEDE